MVKKSKENFQQCKICGASALFINFGVISCSSCKMFFKRNAELTKKHFICDFNDDCEINILSRRRCSSCRLVKCFASGMKLELIRPSRTKEHIKRPEKKLMTESMALIKRSVNNQLPTLSLLRSDKSTLSFNQWNLLSNLMHCYDEHSGLLSAYCFKSEQNALPIKLRYKLGPVGEFITANMSIVPRIFENNRDFLSLRLHDRLILLRNTVKHTGCIGATFVLYQAQLLNDLFFYKSSEVIFGREVMSTIKPLVDSFDPDVIFIKLVLTIVAFSTVSYTVYINTAPINIIDIKTIIHIQDTYTELTWKYLVYKYSYEQAIKRFCHLLRCLFNVNLTIVEVNRRQEYTNMIDTVVEQTKEILSLHN